MTQTALERHIAAIESGTVTRTNIIGIRKLYNKAQRNGGPWHDIDRLQSAIERHEPMVTGEWLQSGLAVLRNKRYARRWTDAQQRIIDTATAIRLVDMIPCGHWQYTPAYRVESPNGHFHYSNTPWQSGGNGPEILE